MGPGPAGGGNSGHASGRSILGRPLRAADGPVRPQLVDRKPDDSIRAAERIERILHDSATLPERPPQPDEPDTDEPGTDEADGEPA